jgi:hypothetical protein
MQTSGGGSAGVAILFILLLYFIPTIVGAVRKVPNIGSVLVINLFLGWTLIGWVVALAMAARSASPPSTQFVIPSAQPVPTAPPQTTSESNIVYTHAGVRYLFGYTLMNPTGYAIWDRENLGPAILRFPYNEHGREEGFAQFRKLETNGIELSPPRPGPEVSPPASLGS